MALVVPVGFAAANIQFTLAGFARPAFCTFGISILEVSDPVAVANEILTGAQTAHAANTDTAVTVGPVELRVGQDDGTTIPFLSSTAPWTGTAARSSPTPNVAVLVQKNTSRGGRKGRGRLYWPWGVDEANLNENGTMTAATLTAQQTQFNNWLDQLDGGTFHGGMYLLHNDTTTKTTRTEDSKTITVVPVEAPPPDRVLSLTVKGLISTQRRRLDR